MSIKDILSKLIVNLNKNKLKNFGSLLKKSFEVDLQNYKELNLKKRISIQEETFDSILNAVEKNDEEELNNNTKKIIRKFSSNRTKK